MTAMGDIDWSLGTYEGIERDREQRLATTTPAERLAWLEDALALAASSGALAQARTDKQRELDELWAAGEATLPTD